MLAAIRSAAVLGIDAYDVTVEVDAAQGLPQWTIVGLPLGAVKESRERVGSALVNSGFLLPPRRITVNLAPADQPKAGSAFDLPIAIGILVATGQLDPTAVTNRIFVGELSLNGTLRHIRGALSVARYAGRLAGAPTLVIPPVNLAEAGRVSHLPLAAPETLRTLVEQLRGGYLPRAQPPSTPPMPRLSDVDFSDVVGQDSAKRALEVAAAGGHNVLLVGPPGAGKTMLARRLPTILPPLTKDEALEVIAVHSVAGLLSDDVTLGVRPFRAPHHTISSAGLIGGGSTPRPGEVSLAHNGVLFLDEMLEFHRTVLDGLRQPLEDGSVVIARAAMSVSFPARFTLVGATNACPCGRTGGPQSALCTCSARQVENYMGHLSGPLADRIDMHVTVEPVPLEGLMGKRHGERSADIRARVGRVRTVQEERRQRARGAGRAESLGRALLLDTAAQRFLQLAADKLFLSARSYTKVIRVARTIADIAGAEEVSQMHAAEALRYRPSVRA